MAFADWFMPLMSGLTGAAQIGTGIANTVHGAEMDEAALAEQKRMNDFNINQAQLNNAFQEKQFSAQQDLNKWQQNFAMNQTQYSAIDAEKAGINRLAMTGNNAAGSTSVAGGALNGASGSSQSYGQGISAMAQLSSNLGNISNGIASRSMQKSIAAAGNKNAYDIAKLADDAKKAQLGFDKEKWNLEKEKLSEESRNIHFLNEYEAAHGTPYQHRNQLADGIVAIAGLLKNTLSGKGELADLGKLISESLGATLTSSSAIAGDLSDYDVEKIAEIIAEELPKKKSTSTYSPSKNRARDANDNRYGGR